MERPEPQSAINDVVVKVHAAAFVNAELEWLRAGLIARFMIGTPSILGHVTAVGPTDIRLIAHSFPRSNIGKVSSLGDAVATFNSTERRPGKTVIRVALRNRVGAAHESVESQLALQFG
ncbi:hypothetical protein [Rhizobium sp. P32RR-XVIII]|uniref:hypothetical protein n=1 Tax=Rhizobium sp. P32RR-XVIII TaxID=2726738 RepID=UPI003917CACD